jgi:pimeloyl-[acyl-carrier protein] methyl ester esterase
MRRVIVLPGMHGTTNLLSEFASTAPSDVRVELVALPPQKLDYLALTLHFAATLRLSPDSVLVAESFSGPLAIMLAERCNVAALILCNTFATAPYPSALRAFPLSQLARIPPPSFLVRHYAVGWSASAQLVSRVRDTVAVVPHDVLAFRTRCALSVDVTSVLAKCKVPILYVRGTEDRLVRDRSVAAIVAAAGTPVSVANIRGPHLVLTTAPREVWQSISEFLSLHELP